MSFHLFQICISNWDQILKGFSQIRYSERSSKKKNSLRSPDTISTVNGNYRGDLRIPGYPSFFKINLSVQIHNEIIDGSKIAKYFVF